MYRTIDVKFWNDPKVRKLSPSAKLLFLYFVTNPATHVSGLYCLPMATIVHETGMTRAAVGDALDTLSSAGIVRIDSEIDAFWVCKMMAYQGRGEKNMRSAAHHLRDLHNSRLVQDFLEAYPDVKRFLHPEAGYPIQPADVGATPEQKKEIEHGEETRNKNIKQNSVASESPPLFDAADEVVLTFPTNVNDKPWHLRQSKLAEYRETFPGIDALAECRKALQWCRDNPEKRKTLTGMARFLNRWLGQAQNNGGYKYPQVIGQGPMQWANFKDNEK